MQALPAFNDLRPFVITHACTTCHTGSWTCICFRLLLTRHITQRENPDPDEAVTVGVGQGSRI